MSKSLDRLTLLETFIQIAESGSISAASRTLGQTQPTTSRQLVELESRLSTQLIRRTTHSLSLTHAGHQLLVEAKQLIDAWDGLEETHLIQQREVRGTLKVVAPVALGQIHLARIAMQFQMDYPGVLLNWQLDDQAIRFNEVGCDCWIKVGDVPDDMLVVKKLGEVERLLLATPEYLQRNGHPKTPKTVERCDFVSLEPFEGGQIPIVHSKRPPQKITPPVRMTTNNIFALKEAVLMSLGIGVLPRWFVQEELSIGQLVDVLPTWRAPTLTIHVAHAAGRYQPRRLRVFSDMLTKEVGKLPGIA